MQLRVLGCSGGVGPGRETTCFALGDHTLIDAGTGVGRLTLEQMHRLTDVFLTHAHLDHVAGLAFVADNRFGDCANALRVHARPPVLQTLRRHVFNWKLWPDFTALRCGREPVLSLHRMRLGQRVAHDGLQIKSVPARHTVPACGYAIESSTGTLVYSGDTTACTAFWRALNRLPRLDHLIIEVAFSDEQEALGELARHYTPALLGRELAKLRHRPQLHLMHHKPGRDEAIVRQCAQALCDWNYGHLQRDDVIEF